MSMINGMYIAFSILAAFAVSMAWWSVRQKLQEGQDKKKTETSAVGKNGEQS